MSSPAAAAEPRALRCLLVVPPLAGHLNPARALADAWEARGHLAAWVGPEPALRPVLGPQALVHPTGSRLFREQAAGGPAAVRSLWDGFVVPYARFTLRTVRRAVAAWRPDVVLVDQHSPAGALAAHELSVPWASFAPSSLELGRPLRGEPELEQWLDGVLRGLWTGAGLPAAEFTDPRLSPGLVIAPSCRTLLTDGPDDGVPDHHALVGPLLGPRPAVAFPWDDLDPDRRRVLVTMGTLSADVSAGFHRRTAAALTELAGEVQAVVAAPAELLDDLRGELPPGTIGLPRVPVLGLLRRGAVDAVLCHGGMNTVCETLVHGLPLVVAPIRHDQPITAARLAAAGAAVRVDFAEAGPKELLAALRAVLEDPSHRAAAAVIGRQLSNGGGTLAAVERLERFASARH